MIVGSVLVVVASLPLILRWPLGRSVVWVCCSAGIGAWLPFVLSALLPLGLSVDQAAGRSISVFMSVGAGLAWIALRPLWASRSSK